MNPTIRAFSICQPYAELILQGKKTKEFRSRRTHIRERVYLYASLTPGDDLLAWRVSGKVPGSLPTGKIVGTVEIVRCEPTTAGGYAYKLTAPQRLASPLVPINHSRSGFWRPQF